MFRPYIRNHSFDYMGEKFAPLIDRDHFLGHSSLRYPWKEFSGVNLRKKDQLFEMEVSVPGFEKKHLKIEVQEDVLTVFGNRSERNDQATSKYILEETDEETFVKRFRLGKGIGRERITASCQNGTLRITFTDVPAEQEKSWQEVIVT